MEISQERGKKSRLPLPILDPYHDIRLRVNQIILSHLLGGQRGQLENNLLELVRRFLPANLSFNTFLGIDQQVVVTNQLLADSLISSIMQTAQELQNPTRELTEREKDIRDLLSQLPDHLNKERLMMFFYKHFGIKKILENGSSITKIIVPHTPKKPKYRTRSK